MRIHDLHIINSYFVHLHNQESRAEVVIAQKSIGDFDFLTTVKFKKIEDTVLHLIVDLILVVLSSEIGDQDAFRLRDIIADNQFNEQCGRYGIELIVRQLKVLYLNDGLVKFVSNRVGEGYPVAENIIVNYDIVHVETRILECKCVIERVICSVETNIIHECQIVDINDRWIFQNVENAGLLVFVAYYTCIVQGDSVDFIQGEQWIV